MTKMAPEEFTMTRVENLRAEINEKVAELRAEVKQDNTSLETSINEAKTSIQSTNDKIENKLSINTYHWNILFLAGLVVSAFGWGYNHLSSQNDKILDMVLKEHDKIIVLQTTLDAKK